MLRYEVSASTSSTALHTTLHTIEPSAALHRAHNRLRGTLETHPDAMFVPRAPDYARGMTDPREDRDDRDQLAEASFAHRPGMAAEMMQELAPLLAADGFDLDDLGDVDIDDLNAAMTRANERRNLDLFTPVGERHAQALAVLHQVAVSIADGEQETARAIVQAVEPDPGESSPSVAQVIGAGLGLLDSWHSNPALRTASEGTRVPAWDKRSSAAATDILAIARKGRAFDALDRLIANHGGLAVLEGSALTVAASLISRAHVQGTSVSELADEALGGDAAAAAPRRRRPAPAASTMPPPPDAVLAREFRSWLGQQPHLTSSYVTRTSVDLISLRGTLRSHGLDLYRAEDIPAVVDQLLAREPDDLEAQFADLLTLDMYAHHRLERSSGAESAAWDQAHDVIERVVTEVERALEELDDALEEGGAVAEALREAEQIPSREREEALARTRLVSAVRPLLEWLGAGRSCSPAGGVRRADIEEVAAMLGISAVGVNKRPPLAPSGQEDVLAAVDLDEPLPAPETIHALSMIDVPVLAAWWRALMNVGLLDRQATRVRPGPAAGPWESQPVPPLEASEELIEDFLLQFLFQDLDKPGPLEGVDEAVTSAVASELLIAGVPGLTPPRPSGALHQILMPRIRRKLQDLADLGLLTVDAEREFQVPPALRSAVAHGAAAVIAEDEDSAGEDSRD